MNNRGTAGLETIALIGAFLLVAGVFLALAYLWFAKSYTAYQSEQALLCLAEQQPSFVCRRNLRARLQTALPFGDVRRLNLRQESFKQWRLELEWGWKSNWLWGKKDYVLRTEKQMSIKGISRNKVGWR